MAEPPAIKIHRDYENPPNISAEVPGEQMIRELDSNYHESRDVSTSSEVTGMDYTLSPVITVTKNETALTKGDLKLQKVTVTEDIAVMDNGGHSKSYTGEETTAHTDRSVTRTVNTMESREVTHKTSTSEEKNHAAKKSKIPLLKFKQTVEQVQNERQKDIKDQPKNKRRRSSIPKLKDAKAVKRTSSLKVDQRLDDEFEKLYEEVVDNNQNGVDDKILVVNVDDPEKVETKFEEIIHAYDSNDDIYFTPSEKLKLSKIPWRKKDTASKTGAVDKTTVTNSKFKDGGFKVSASTITTKRFSRGNSMDLSKTQRKDVVESSREENLRDNKAIKETTTTAIVIEPRATSLAEIDGVKRTRTMENFQDSYEEKMEIEEIQDGRKITKAVTRIPVKPQRVNRSISRELNRRPTSLDDRDFVTKEVVKHEEFKDGTSKTILRETVIKEPQIRTEKITRSISRTFSRDGKSVTLLKNRLSYNDDTETLSRENHHSNKFNKISDDENIQNSNQNALKVKKNTKNCTHLPMPVINKTTHSYDKGSVENVEGNRSVEWMTADEIIPKEYGRSYSENKLAKNDTDDKRPKKMIEKNKIISEDIKLITSPIKTKGDVLQSSVIDNNDDIKYIQILENDEKQLNILRDDDLISSEKVEYDISTNYLESSQKNTERPPQISKILSPQEQISKKDAVNIENKDSDEASNTQTVTILKGNVNRLISQLSVKDSDLSIKDIDAEEELPKKKSVLSKIAMFEGKDAEYTIKINKCTPDKKTIPTADVEKMTKPVNELNITQPKLDYLNNNVYVPKGINKDIDGITFNDDPVIVDQIYKYQEENISTLHQVQGITFLPEAIDFTVSDNNIEINEQIPEANKTLKDEVMKSNKDYTEQIILLPEKLDFIHSEEQIQEPELLPGKINFKSTESQTVTAAILPSGINVASSENGVILKGYLEKNISANTDNGKKTQQPKVGKLNLDLWNKQVQINKQLVTKGKPKGHGQIKAQKMTTTKMVHENEPYNNRVFNKIEIPSETLNLPGDVNFSKISKNENPIILPREIKLKSVQHSEIPTILPMRSEFKFNIDLNKTPKLLPERLDFDTNEGQLQVPVILPETPLTKSTKLTFESQKSQIEVPATVSYTTELNTNIYTAVTTNVTQDIITSKVHITPLGHNTESQLYETPRTLPGIIDNITNEAGFAKPKLVPERIDFKTERDVEDIKRSVPIKNNLNPYNNIFKLNNNIDLDKEVPSDPELVDSEPEIKDTKDTIMGKLKNKVFIITNRNANKNKAAYSIQKSTSPTIFTPVDDFTNETEFIHSLNESTVSKDKLEITNELNVTNNRVQNNFQDFNVEYESREDKKRTKSLAELDLGDAVKGQVQRMVYRIKSVDFDKMETSKTRKISLKEMPKKSSVLEKIAMFEGKATATTSALPKPLDIATTSKNITQPDRSITEEMYLRKIEELSTVKLRYSKSDMLYLNLGNGDQMPAIALGTAMLDPRLTPHIVSAAIDLGYRAIDTAFIYGTEQLVGQGIKKKTDDGTITRGELFIIGKLWSTFHKPELVETACRSSLEALGLDYFDLYMIHNPMSLKEGGGPIPQIANVLQFSQYDYMDAWFAMEALVSKGLVKTIGVSNFNSHQIQKILDKGHIKPVVNQVECHPYLTQQPLQAFCTERNITLSCFSVLGSKGTPAEYKTGVEPAIDDPLVKVMASGLNVTPAQLLVRYQIQSGRQAVIKATTPGHLYDVLQALTFVLEPHQIDALNALNRNKRIFDMKKLGELHKNYPFKVPF